MHLDVVILAAGLGKRMVSDKPKVLHPIAGKPMLAHVLDTTSALAAERRMIIVGHGREQVQNAFAEQADLIWIEQPQLLGTGDAVARALPVFDDQAVVLVLFADVPLVTAQTLRPVISEAEQGHLGLLSVLVADPSGYGRIVRDAEGQVIRIVEHKDASPEQRAINEINTGILAVPAKHLRTWLQRINNDNAQGEYYLTDVIEFAVADGITVAAHRAQDADEMQGINDRVQLAVAERNYQHRQAQQLMLNGVTLLDPQRIDIRGELHCGRDVVIDANVVFEGRVELADRVTIGPNTLIRNSTIGADCVVHAHSIVDGAALAEQIQIGPFARLRPGACLAKQSRIGNFVEVKNAQIGQGSKANHLSYIGDAEVGNNVNIGAGTITCNYDGANKHKTTIEDDVFIGSNSALVAPIKIGKESNVGAGSTLSKDVPEKTLSLTRANLRQIQNWKRPLKKTK